MPYELHKEIEAAFIEHRPYGDKTGSYTLVPRSSNVVRAKLAAMVRNDEFRKQSAASLLGEIEEWRLEYGRPVGEPRNPCLDTGENWPAIDPFIPVDRDCCWQCGFYQCHNRSLSSS